MPGLYTSHFDRRRFLWLNSSLAVATATTPMSWASLDSQAENITKFALLSDTHIPGNKDEAYRGFRPFANLEQALPQVVASGAQTGLICGDAARAAGLADDYRMLKNLLNEHKSPSMTIALGNHDDRENFRKIFEPGTSAEAAAVGKHVSILEGEHVRWIVLDSLLYVDRVAGLLGKTQRNWLTQTISEHADKPILLMVHHTLGDEDGELLDASFLKALASGNKHVQAVFYGHSHVFEIKKLDHVHLVNLPALGYNFRDDQPVGWMSAETKANSITLSMHAIAGDRSSDGKDFELPFSG